jgi:DNA-binding response OmpR family regulator
MTALRVLIIDDSVFTGDAVGYALRKAGFDVQVARDLWGLEGEVPKPDLVLMDVVLSEAFGDDLAPLLRASHGFDCPILLMSSLPDDELRQRAEDAGLEGFASKRGGLAGIVQRVREVLGNGASSQVETPASREQFEITAHQRLRRVLHIAAEAEHWNMAAITAEMHALAGDADLAGAPAIAEAARTCRDTAREHGAAGWAPQVGNAIQALANAVGGAVGLSGRLLVVDGSTFSRDTLLPALDRAGYVVMEAYTVAEARQKLHATRYDLILVDHAIQSQEPTLVPELRGALPDVKLEIVGVRPLAKDLEATRLVAEIERMVKRRP